MEEAYRWYRQGEWERAATVVEALVDRGRASPADLAFLGTCYLNAGEAERAEELIGAAAMLAPDSYPVLIARANLELSRGRYPQAEERFLEALERAPGRPAATEGAAQAAFRSGAKLLEEGEYEAAVAPLKRAAGRQPDNERILTALILALKQTGRREELMAAYDRYLELHPQSADALAGRGLLRYAAGDTRRALAELRRAVELDTGEPEAYLLLAEEAQARGDGKEARLLLHEAIGKAVQLYSLYRMQAARTMERARRADGGSAQMGDPEQMGARVKSLKAISEHAARPRRMLIRALALLPGVTPDRSTLLEDLRRLADWYPNTVELRSALAEELGKAGREAEAREMWMALSRDFAFSYVAHLGAARSWEREGRERKALISYRRALDLAPEEPEVYRRLAGFYRRRGEPEAYLELLEGRMVGDAYNPLLYEEAARAASELGRDAEAGRYRSRAEKLRRMR